ncbi:MAG TPA: phosphate ABC transporter permease PstA [Ilumatobacteraceae bacterium]|nr:phosphate ABC transporter permease PstA [Ilumatobacteraceae bacterium]
MNSTIPTEQADEHRTKVARPARATTVLPPRPDPHSASPQRRAIGRVSRQDVLVLIGAGGSAFCTTMLLFGRLTAMSGKLGFATVFFALFLGSYALLVSLTERGPAVIDKVMTALLTSAATLAGVALLSVVTFILWKGHAALFKSNLYLDDMSRAGPLDPLTVGGIAHAIVGTLVIISLCLLFTVPLGVTCAVFLNETRGRITGFVRTVVTAMTALPSILAGLFIFATWILILGYQRSGLAASLAVSIMMLPIIIRSADVVLRLVPGNLREASQALGSSQWRTVWHVVLPTARSGLSTSVILGVARGVGETAPVLLTSGITSTMNLDPRRNPMMSLPLATFEFVRSPQPTLVARGFATAAVLMILVLMLFSLARFLGGRPAGRLSKRQARRNALRSERDLERFEGRHIGVGA